MRGVGPPEARLARATRPGQASIPLGLSLREGWLDRAETLGLELVELVADAWMFRSEAALARIDRLRRDLPVHLHCLGLNLGSADGLDPEYVDRVKALADRWEAEVSDHFGWRSVDGEWSSTFLPLPHRSDVLGHVAARVHAVQERLGRVLALETPSEYVFVPEHEHSLSEALWALHEACGTEVVLDVCNLRVSEQNVGALPAEAVVDALAPITRYVHLAGFSRGPSLWIDDHGSAPELETIALFARAGRPGILEWDRRAPASDGVVSVLRDIRGAARGERSTRPEGFGKGYEPGEPPSPFYPRCGTFPGLEEWQRRFATWIHEKSVPQGFAVLRSDLVFSALEILEVELPATRATLGDGFRYFVRRAVERGPWPSDVHGRTWPGIFARQLLETPELCARMDFDVIREECEAVLRGAPEKVREQPKSKIENEAERSRST